MGSDKQLWWELKVKRFLHSKKPHMIKKSAGTKKKLQNKFKVMKRESIQPIVLYQQGSRSDAMKTSKL